MCCDRRLIDRVAEEKNLHCDKQSELDQQGDDNFTPKRRFWLRAAVGRDVVIHQATTCLESEDATKQAGWVASEYLQSFASVAGKSPPANK